MNATALRVTSHVGRDLLQSAALFKHEQTVVWEYVSNGLEYIDAGVQPVVDVKVDAKSQKITVRDNGRGMTSADLGRYFQMHGENIDRKKGKAGRGMFGTGKSAAFGIGDLLRLTTVRDGKRSKVQLERKDIAASEGDGIPVQTIESDVATDEPNGTFIEVEGIHLKRMDIASIVRHIERHIARWPNATVFVNRQPCNIAEPPYSETRKFASKGTPFEETLGEVELVVKIAKSSLEPEWQGISILSQTVWHSTTLAGCENKPFANYIFGELDVEKLSRDNSPIPPFDMSRSMQLNPKNELVAAILAFIGPHIEGIRREIEKGDRERKRAQDARRLEEEASAIAKIINQDFDSWRNQLQRTMAKVPGGKDKLAQAATVEELGEAIVRGDEFSAVAIDDELGVREPRYQPDPEPNPNPEPQPIPPEPGPSLERSQEDTETKAKSASKKRTSTSGGFKVDFSQMGTDAQRAKYVADERTIFVNLEHPQISNALAIGGIEDIAFRRLSYEVAFSEYAIALASEMARSDLYTDFGDPIYDIRETLNRISRSAASLYSKA